MAMSLNDFGGFPSVSMASITTPTSPSTSANMNDGSTPATSSPATLEKQAVRKLKADSHQGKHKNLHFSDEKTIEVSKLSKNFCLFGLGS
jgi:hypothetical protein